MTKVVPLSDYLSDLNVEKRSAISAVMDHFVSYMENLYDTSDYHFVEFLDDADHDLTAIFHEMTCHGLSIGFSISVKLVGGYQDSDSVYGLVDIEF